MISCPGNSTCCDHFATRTVLQGQDEKGTGEGASTAPTAAHCAVHPQRQILILICDPCLMSVCRFCTAVRALCYFHTVIEVFFLLCSVCCWCICFCIELVFIVPFGFFSSCDTHESAGYKNKHFVNRYGALWRLK